jgi:hypothetical protein
MSHEIGVSSEKGFIILVNSDLIMDTETNHSTNYGQQRLILWTISQSKKLSVCHLMVSKVITGRNQGW